MEIYKLKDHDYELKRIKREIINSYEYFKDNIDTFNFFKNFIFITSLSENDKTFLIQQNKPVLEFNILEAYISRIRGEFSKNEPDFEVSPKEIENSISYEQLNILQGYLNYILFEANNDSFSYEILLDTLGGGFSVGKVITKYINERSFDQKIEIELVDPTMCGFDPLAKKIHKGDGRFCFQIYPKTKDEFEREFPDVNISGIKFYSDFESFKWSYQKGSEKILLVADFYEKKKRKIKLFKLSNGKSLTEKEYKEFINKWNESGNIIAPPEIIDTRETYFYYICRYQLTENKIFSYEETIFTELPLVFFDGNSVKVRNSGMLKQKTRPYVYHAKDAQRLKNFSGQTQANELENLTQTKWIVPKEGIPAEYLENYKNPQMYPILPFNAYKKDNPDIPLPPPREAQKIPTPPEVMQTFTLTDSLVQNILGSYDASLGINNNQLSSVAIKEAALQSNPVAEPYIIGFMAGLTQIGQIIIDLIPSLKLKKLPTLNKEKKREYVLFNPEHDINIEYPTGSLEVKVKASYNFRIQKEKALSSLIMMMNSSQIFQEFMSSDGLPILIDNLDIKGTEQLKDKVDAFIKKLEKNKMIEQQQQIQNDQNNPINKQLEIEQMKIKQKDQENIMRMQVEMAKIAVDKEKVDNERMEVLLEANQSQENHAVQMMKAETEQSARAIDLAIKELDVKSKHFNKLNGS